MSKLLNCIFILFCQQLTNLYFVSLYINHLFHMYSAGSEYITHISVIISMCWPYISDYFHVLPTIYKDINYMIHYHLGII